MQGAGAPGSGSGLVNLMMTEDLPVCEPVFYGSNCNMPDNIVVSDAVLKSRVVKVENNKGTDFSTDWIIFINKNGDKIPNRSNVGNKYVGGVSDHFPVYFRMMLK